MSKVSKYWFAFWYSFLLLQHSVFPQNVSPCPRIFQYVFDGADWIGIVEIPSPMLGQSVTIHVHLTIRAVLPTAYFGKIELMSPRSEILQDILAHRPVRYRVRFPLPSPIPKLSAIVLNGQPICSAVPDSGGIITTIKLEHTLYTTSANGEINTMYSGMDHHISTFGLNLGPNGGPQMGPEGNDLWSFGAQPPGQNFQPQNPILQPQNPPFRPTSQKPQGGNFQPTGGNLPQKPLGGNFENQGGNLQPTGGNLQPHGGNFQPTGGNLQPQKPLGGNFQNQGGSVHGGNLQPQGGNFQPQGGNFQTDWGNLAHQQQTQRPEDILPTRPTLLIPPFRPPPVATNPPSRVGQNDPNVVLREMDAICGRALSRPNNLVVRGEVARKGDWPWMVALYVITDTGLNFNCGASLVSRKVVVTAAHCLFGPDNRQHDKEKILLILGRFNINDWTDNAVRAPIERAEPHPDYRQNTLGTDADIALLILKQRVEFTELIRPLCLWRGSDRLEPIVGMNATVVGWGRDETGQKTTPEPRIARVPVVSRETCLLSKEEFRHLITSNRTFCAGAKGSGPCNGDSGGGLMLPQGDRWSLRGIVSVSLVEQISKQCDVNEFIIFTDATQFHKWIVSFMTE